MMRTVNIVNLTYNTGNTVYTYPSGVGIGGSLTSYPTTYSMPQILQTLQAASMKSCANDIIKFFDDNEDLISVFKLMPGMVVMFV